MCYTYYEVSRINDQTFFSVTPIPVFILNNQSPSGNDPCIFAPPEQPFLGPGFSLTTGFSQPAAPTNTGTQDTVTVTFTTTLISTVATSITTTQTVTLSDGEIETTLVLPTSFPTTVTTVFTTASSGFFNPINAAGRTISVPFLLIWTFTSSVIFMLMLQIS
ncbi:hypothetical protein RhiLY_04290 [Ceratobasidium sp. AG-Ba]|nr:hypothetical protein RhiLY_04290 [Ceratobasidium sp. AG-Ba]